MAKFFTPTKLSDNIRETPEGYLLCLNVPIARTGWQEYGPGETPIEVGEEGVVWIYRDSKEVFRPQTIASFLGKSVTIKHPNDFVEPKNWKMLTHGIAQNVRKSDEKDDEGEECLIADLLITDDFAIGLVQNGLREVSCGYDAEYEETGDGEGRQFNIIGNHIALVEQGRAGSAYAIKDHKGKADEIMKLKELGEKIRSLGKTVDEAVVAENEAAEKLKKKKAAKVDDAAPEQVTYDDIIKAVKDLEGKMDGMMASKKASDEEEEHIEDEEEKPAKKDKEEMSDDNEAEAGMAARLDKLEAAVAKILQALGNKGAEDEDEEEMEDDSEEMSGAEDEDEEESEDAEGEEGEESQKKSKAGDAAMIEILTPGKKFSGKDAREKCLKVFAKTEDGAKVLKQLGMKKPVFDAKANFDMVFMAAHALVKASRGTGLGGTRDGAKWKSEDVDNTASEPISAEQMNEINAKYFGQK